MTDQLNVWLEERLVGSIRREGKVQMCFAYDPSWLRSEDSFPLSLSIPFQSDPFSWEATRAFFDNLLPEQSVREKVSKRLQINSRHTYALLEGLGAECAGALSILPSGEKPLTLRDARYQGIDSKSLSQLIAEIPQRPLLAGEDGVRLSLAGAQPKLPIVKREQSYYLPLNGAPSTHILKPPISDLSESVENEAFCLYFARVFGLDVPDVELTSTRPRGYIVRRYDRLESAQGITRIHQEDFCQALGLPPEVKYENDGGPGLEDCFNVLDRCRDPEGDKEKLLRLCIFNFHIGNTDAHAKNLSLLFDAPGGPRLAPFYDLLCTTIYKGLARKMAMRYGTEYNPDFIMRRHWEQLGKLAGWSEKATTDLVVQLVSRMIKLRIPVADAFCRRYGESPTIRRINNFIDKRCTLTLERLAS